MSGVTAAPLLRPAARRARFWVVLALVVLAGAALIAALSSPPNRALDPRSASKDGSLALARLLGDRGVEVRRTTSLATVGPGTVLVAFPDDYRSEQLRELAAGHRVVLLAPGPDALKALLAGRQADTTDTEDVTVPPGCADAGAQAAGAVRFPAGTTTYVGTSVPPSGDSGPAGTSCYGGRIELTGNVVVFGSADLLRNDVLADPGVAALDLNALDQNGRGGASLTWLLPGADARGSGPATIWTVLPGWTPRAVVWLLVIGGLVVLWRARRLGPVVGEPLPVVVRAVEIVEGHGRLYLRAGARDRAAGQLRAATSRRLADRFGMPPAAIPLTAEERATLSGPPPVDDAELVRLANALHELDRGGSRHD